jgi:hypothetical protein
MYADTNTNPMIGMLSQTVSAPLVLCILASLMWFAARRRIDSPAWFVAPAAAAGFIVAYAAIQGRAVFPPRGALDVIAVIAVAGAALEWFRAWRPASRSWARVVVLVLVAITTGWMLYPVISRFSAAGALAAVAGVTIAFALFQFVAGLPLNRRVDGAVYLFTAAAAAPVIALDGTLKIAQVSGALAACLGVLWAAGLVFREHRFNLEFFAPWLIASVYAAAYFYADIDPAALLALPVGIAMLAGLRRLWPVESIWLDNLRLILAGALPLAVALWRVWPEQSLY